jgi:hypothetical protein
MLWIYLIICLSLASTSWYYYKQWQMNRRRRDDLVMARCFLILSISYILYAFEASLRNAKGYELVIDALLAVYLMATVLVRLFKKK